MIGAETLGFGFGFLARCSLESLASRELSFGKSGVVVVETLGLVSFPADVSVQSFLPGLFVDC